MNRTTRLVVSLALNFALVVVQLCFAAVARSTGLAADAGHNLVDVGALALSLVAVHLARRPATPARSFGNHRATILAALGNAGMVVTVTILIAGASIFRFAHPVSARGGIMVVVAALGLAVNGIATLVLHDRSGDLNLRAALVHSAGDALSSAAVVAAGAVLLLAPGATWIDPASALVVAAVIVVQASRILSDSVSVLLESAPRGLDVAALESAMEAVPGVSQVHDLHVWSLSSDVRLLSAHVVVAGHPSLEEAQATGERVKRAIAVPFAVVHSTLELECERCEESEDTHCRMAPSPAVQQSETLSGHRH